MYIHASDIIIIIKKCNYNYNKNDYPCLYKIMQTD